MITFRELVDEIHNCKLCQQYLPFESKPIISLGKSCKLLIIGQAPGKIAHETNMPWNDKSGERLRRWLCIDSDTFYDQKQVSLLPMGFCFPGYKRGADAPPRKECAPFWHEKVLQQLSHSCTLLVGRYAQQYYLPKLRTLSEAVQQQPFTDKNIWCLPHPSGRNNRWLAKSPWFEQDKLPQIQRAVRDSLKLV